MLEFYPFRSLPDIFGEISVRLEVSGYVPCLSLDAAGVGFLRLGHNLGGTERRRNGEQYRKSCQADSATFPAMHQQVLLVVRRNVYATLTNESKRYRKMRKENSQNGES